MRVGIATDHGGFGLKEELLGQLRAAGHEVVDFGAHRLSEGDDYPDYVVPLALAVATQKVERGVAMETTRNPEASVETKTKPPAVPTGRIIDFELVIADPDPLGIFGFAFATFLANLSTLGVYSFNAVWLSTMVFLGGLAELIAGLQDYKRNNLFGATVFSFFGAGWTGNAITAWLVTLKMVPETDPISQGWYCLFWAVFVAAMTGASLKLTKVLTAILVLVTLLELGLAIGSFTGAMFITRAGAACGCISAVLGLYLATAGLWNLTFGRTVLPVGEWKR